MMEALGALVLTLFSCIGLLLRYAPFRSIVEDQVKKKIWLSYGVLITVNFVVVLVMVLLWNVQGIFAYLRYGVVTCSVLLTVVNIILIPGRIREHLFVFGVVAACNYLLMAIPNYLVTFLENHSIQWYISVIFLAYGAFLVLTFFPLRRLLCRTVEPFLHMQAEGYWNTLWFIPVALFGTRFFFVGGQHNDGGVQQLLSSALTGAVIIVMCWNISHDHARIQYQQNLEKQLTDQKLHYKQLQTRVEDARKTRHDLKHHIAAILHMVEMDDKESVRAYCNEMRSHVESQESIPYTGNTATDGVLYHYLQRARAEKINLHYAGTINNPGISDMDLCVLLGNALDNALTACATAPGERSVHLISQSQKQLLSMVIRNTFDGKVEQGSDGLLSRKRQNSTGVGLKSMKSVCERYGGSLEISWDDNTFTVVILLPLKEES